MNRLTGLVALGAVLCGAAPIPAASSEASWPGDAFEVCGASGTRFLGFSDALDKTSFGAFAVTELSGLAYDGNGSYRAVADRAGSVQSHTFELTIPVATLQADAPTITAVTVLKDPSGTPFTGATFDGEGIVARQDGTSFVASEGGSLAGEQPEIRQFAADGTHLASLLIPGRFLIGTNNLSFESLTQSPGGHVLFTATEGPLAADGRTADLRSRLRIVRFEETEDAGFQPAGEFFYLTEPGRTTSDVGLAELLAVSPTSLLVLERGFVAGLGNTIRVYQVSTAGAQDVSGIGALAAADVAPLAKTLIVDLVDCPDGGATVAPGATQPNPLLENFEAMAFGPELAGGMRSLVLLSDDNGSTVQHTRVVALGVPHAILAPAQ